MKIIVSIMLFLSFEASSSEISNVSAGNTITANKINEIINAVNESKKFQQEFYSGGTLSGVTTLKYTTPTMSSKSDNTANNEFYTHNSSTGAFTVNKKAQFDLTFSGRSSTNEQVFIIELFKHDEPGVAYHVGVETSVHGGDTWGSTSFSQVLEVGDTFYFKNLSSTPLESARCTVLATNKVMQ